MQVRAAALAASVLLTAGLGGCSGGAGAPTTQAPAAASSGGSAATAAPRPTPTLAPGVTGVIDPPFNASGILADGKLLWAEDHAKTGRVYAIDPETGEVVHRVDARRPCDIAALDGRIWYAEVDAGMVVAIDPETGKVDDEITGLHGPCGLQAADGVLWAAVNEGIARIDPAAGSVDVTELGEAAFPGSGTPIWAALFDSKVLVHIDAATGAELARVDPPGGVSYDLPLAEGFGSLWAGNSDIYRLDPETGAVEVEFDGSGGASRLLITDDSVWFTNYLAGSVSRIDPATNQVVYRAHLGGNPNGITEGWGSIWVSDTLSGRLFRIDPAASGLPG